MLQQPKAKQQTQILSGNDTLPLHTQDNTALTGGARREKLLALTKETYLSEGKLLVDELQQAIKDNSNNAYKVILLCYERAVKDIYSYPIAALYLRT